MKAIISRVDLAKLTLKLQSVIPTRPAIPILANLLLEARDGQLILTATDLIVSMRLYMEAKVVTPGAITIPARRFFQLIRELTSPQIEINAPTPDSALISAGTSKFKLVGMDKTEFPDFPDMKEALSFSMKSSAVKEMLSRSSFAASRDDSRQVFNGTLLKVHSGIAECIGTDGKRLAKTSADVPVDTTFSGEYILPIKAVEEILHLLDGSSEMVKLSLMAGKVGIDSDSTQLVTMLVSGNYPDITRIVPEKGENPLILHREELISLLRQVNLFTPDNSSSARFIFEQGELQIIAQSGDVGEGNVAMAVNYSGEPLTLALNPHYFLDILRHSTDETVALTISNPFNPALITDSTTAQFVIMPMRIQSESLAGV